MRCDVASTLFSRIVAVVVIVGSASGIAAAQELAGSFDQLRVLVKVGDRVRITDTAGHDISATIADLGASSLTILAGGVRRDLAENEISTISQRRSDSLANGAKWGFLVGGGLGLLAGAALASGEGNSAVLIPIVALAYGGIGAGIGVGIDGMISGEQVIYARRTTRSARLTTMPVLSHDRRAILLSLGF